LWTITGLCADDAVDDVEQHGDEPVQPTSDGRCSTISPITWSQNAVWRRQAACAFDDLAGDLPGGDVPRPTCAGEEMALHRVLAILDGGALKFAPPDKIAELPDHPDDNNWEACRDGLFQDSDILSLFDPRLDGLEDPDADSNQVMGMGDYRPVAWFDTFDNMQPCDGRRPFRR
jgi:hypothetical protein